MSHERVEPQRHTRGHSPKRTTYPRRDLAPQMAVFTALPYIVRNAADMTVAWPVLTTNLTGSAMTFLNRNSSSGRMCTGAYIFAARSISDGMLVAMYRGHD